MLGAKSPSPVDITGPDYDSLDAFERDFAESAARRNRGCCTRVSQFFGSLFSRKSVPTILPAPLTEVVIPDAITTPGAPNPTRK
jgi:hypothetical protein